MLVFEHCCSVEVILCPYVARSWLEFSSPAVEGDVLSIKLQRLDTSLAESGFSIPFCLGKLR